MPSPLRANWPTPGHRIGPRGWSTTGLLAHLQTVFSVMPSGLSRYVTCRSRLDWPDNWHAEGATWRLGWRPPGARLSVAIGCSAVCPVVALPLRLVPERDDPDAGFAPDADVLRELRNWIGSLQVMADCAIVAECPQIVGEDIVVPLRLWLPRLWLTAADPGDDDGVAIAAVIDRDGTASDAELAITEALAQVSWRAPGLVSPASAVREMPVDLGAVLANLAATDSQIAKLVVGWPRDYLSEANGPDLLRSALHQRPDAYAIDVAVPGRRFLCASPELLAYAGEDCVRALALAGTSVDAGSDSAQLAQEHAVVADFVAETLAQLGATAVSRHQHVRQCGPLKHWATAFEAPRPAGLDALTLAAHLHPTPALLGAPRHRALRLMAATESDPRTWYTGFAGVLASDGSGKGELAALLRGIEPTAAGWRSWAGAGLVAGCDAATEASEIDRKHRAIAAAFGLGPA